MNLNRTAEFSEILNRSLSVSTEAVLDVKQPYLLVQKEDVLKVCSFLLETRDLYFDFLNCITCVDNGNIDNSMDILYHISSIPLEHAIILKTVVTREEIEVPSVSSVWKSADWHEREIFDLFGLRFKNHPDLRRILLPADWKGHPLRKDYLEQESYHGIKIKYEK